MAVNALTRPVKQAVYDANTLSWVAAEQITIDGATVNINATGLATGTKQDTGNTSLASIDTKLTSVATGAKQDTGNASLSSLDTKTPSLGQALAAASTPVVLTAIQQAALTPPAAIAGFALESTQLLQASASKQDAEAVLVGAVTETAPATDIASSGLNGRLQRVAQRISTLIGLLPSALSNGFFQVSLKESIAVAVTGTFFQSTQPVSLATYYGKTLTYVQVNQVAAGLLTLAAADASKKHKVLGAVLTSSLAGTLKFSDGVADLLGPLDIGIAGGFVLPTSIVPYMETGAINRALTLTTTLGAARGVVVVLTEV